MSSPTNDPACTSSQAEDYDYDSDYDYDAGSHHQPTHGAQQPTHGAHNGGPHQASPTTRRPVIQTIPYWTCGDCKSCYNYYVTHSCVYVYPEGYICGHVYCVDDCTLEWIDVEVEGTGSRRSGSGRGSGAGASGSPSSSKKGPKGGSSSKGSSSRSSGGSSSRSGGVRSSRTARA